MRDAHNCTERFQTEQIEIGKVSSVEKREERPNWLKPRRAGKTLIGMMK
jgi:hypothetical protein